MKKNSKMLIAGNNALLAEALLRRLKKDGFQKIVSVQCKLTEQKEVHKFFKEEKPDYCFLLPLIEGGIALNMSHSAELIYQNLASQTNIIHSAWQAGVKKLLFFASSCVYPKNCPQPMKEEYLLTAPLEPTSEPYALAKLAGIKMCQAYNRQYKTSYISVIPATVFGPDDNFELNSSHVISGLMKKFHQAKIKKKSKVTVWGTGRPKREFIYVDDLVDASLFLLQNKNHLEIINVGSGMDISIQDLTQTIKRIVDVEVDIEFDRNKPDGASRKLLDVSNLTSLGWKAKISLEQGIESTYRWYIKHFKD